MILLVTNCRDITTDYVVAELKKRGVAYFRLNTEFLPQALCTMDAYPKNSWSISFGEKCILGRNVGSAYFRRPGIPEAVHGTNEENYVEAEWVSFLKSLYARLSGAWLNDPANIFLAEDKPRQILIAHEIGLKVPFTKITNDLHVVKKTTEMGTTIGKPLRQALLAGEEEKVIFTTRLDEIRDEDAEAIATAPLIVQTEIVKKYDVRVTVVGERMFSTAIFSQVNEETQVDWRKNSRSDLEHIRIQLPNEINEKCLELMRRLNLRYAAIDFICDQQDKLWFLEVNPNGQWAWIENLTGYPIASAIVDELEGIACEESN
ncbi:hypothetical protein HOP52_12245 [Halomonas campisalis]|uniref:ATP-grasp domain-containing protein n=1 Tax=Billgrantia campisalis TaxID=74661 RepID=A0ABS9P9S4_9GAMM|nr:hypothetical protein [Halomonas campisalis]MCG6658523.1 hypothetical protein [Halomonas campisalis]MDR5863384.1 hypothetical protein [Halomonas campisalis]